MTEEPNNNERFFFDQDGCCLWYLVPEDRRADWNEWRELDGEDPESWEAPAYARMLRGRVAEHTFACPAESGVALLVR